jgi:hypothetical protein
MMQRASDLAFKKKYLPREDWTPVDTEPYLKPYLNEVKKERSERIQLDNR